MFKASKFNFWATPTSDKYLIFNGISDALCELTLEEATKAKQCLDLNGNTQTDPEIRDVLINCGFLIPSGVDEVEFLVSRSHKACLTSSVLELVISPTYECNFRCKYCYENFVPGRMLEKIEASILKFIEEQIRRHSRLEVNWFGGEPLLCLETVLRMSEQISQIANRSGVETLFLIATNGYLLNRDNAKLLLSAGVVNIHLTIDGPADCHDRLRVTTNGSATYERILRNMLSILDLSDDVNLTLRVNVDDTNIDRIPELLAIFPQTVSERVTLNITPIRSEVQPVSTALHRKINKVRQKALQSHWKYADVLIPVGRKTHCAADKHCNYQIGPDGTLYKCTPTLSKPEVCVGHISNEGKSCLHANAESWNSASVVWDHCLSCKFLCFCLGGCRIQRLRGNVDMSCRDEYADIENMITNRYIAACNGLL